uniref:chitinase n=1 Tax=Hirsutella thompsonii TaxID=42368 RepID=A0A097F8Q3_HIRTH|nr:chitinase [Hirsutella thompsonii]
MKNWGFDGLDINWEYPSNEREGSDFTRLLQRVRDELDSYAEEHAHGHRFILSIATSVSQEKYKYLELDKLTAVDYINLMAYDFAGQWGTKTGHASNLYRSSQHTDATPFDVASAVRGYVNSGIPAKKILLGIPLYGRSFNQTNGLGQVFTPSNGSQWGEPGIWDYNKLPKNGATPLQDNEAHAWFTYQKEGNRSEFITFEVPQSVRDKVAYIKGQGLAGCFFWQASGDKKGNESLISTSFGEFRQIDETDNYLNYPTSKYDNIRGVSAKSLGTGSSGC